MFVLKIGVDSGGNVTTKLLTSDVQTRTFNCGGTEMVANAVCGAFDAAAGDFNGDGETDLAVMCWVDNDYNSRWSHNGLWVGGHTFLGFTYGRLGDVIGYKGETIVTTTKEKYSQIGMRAEAGDVDGTGKDTVIAISSGGNGRAYLRKMELRASDLTKPTLNYSIGMNIGMPPDDWHKPLGFSIALAPLRGRFGPTTAKPIADQVVAFRKANPDAPTNNYKPQYILNSIKDYNGVSLGNEWDTPVLLAADFLEEGMIVGPVEHYVYRAWGNYVSVIQAPPYHVDFIADPENRASPPALRNYTYVGGNHTVFKRSTKEGNARNMSVMSSSGVSSNKEASSSIGAAFKGFSASFGTSLANATGVESADKYISGKTTDTTTVSSQSPSDRDAVSGMTTDIHVWRYPIYGQQFPPDADPDGKLQPSDLVQYMQYAAPFNPVYNFAQSSVNLDSYTPLHEEGNLFSYPVQPSGTKGYIISGEIAGGTTYTMGLNNTDSVTFTDTMKSSNETSSTNTASTTKSLNAGIGASYKGLSANAGVKASNTQKDAMSQTQTWTSTYTTDDTFGINLVQFNRDMTIAPYFMQPTVFTEEYSGTLHYAFAVRFDKSEPQYGLWDSPASPYKKSPDLALNLPHKYSLKQTQDSTQIPQFTPNHEYTATKLRGLYFIDAKNKVVTGNIVSPGESYEVRVPVANYSFVPTGPFKVTLSYSRGIDDDLNPTPKTKITEETIKEGLQGWASHADVNKKELILDWTVPKDLTPSDAPGETHPYWIHVELDAGNDIAEVHEAWSSNDPGGNNVGYAEIAVLSSADVASLSGPALLSSANGPASVSALSKVSAAKAGDFRFELTNTTAEEIRAAARANETIAVEGRVTYTGDETLTRVHLVFEDGKPADENEHRRLIAEKYFPVIQTGASRNFHFTLTPSKLQGDDIYMYVYGDGLSRIEDHIGVLSTGLPRSDDAGSGGSGGGGCNAGAFGLLGAAALAAFAGTLLKRRL